jgi:23S rRNA (cytidine2498-2'-O)-methyltransferase
MLFKSSFLFTLCQVGAETALKEEVVRESSDFHLAYSQPGFLTFKTVKQDLSPEIQIQWVFVRAYGLSIGRVAKASFDQNILTVAQKARMQFGLKKIRLHVFEKERYAFGERPKHFMEGEWAKKIKAQIMDPSLFFENERSENGDFVLDVIQIKEDQTWLGYHVHSPFHSPDPGGLTPLACPREAPSRAYLKLEETLIWSGLPLKAGDCAVELGSAPGGSCYSLLQRGLQVVGIDPAEMDPLFKLKSKFRHIQKTSASVLREELPPQVDWLVLDMNVMPQVSLFEVDRLGTRMMDSLLGMILTLKLNQWKMARELPSLIAHVKAIGLQNVKMAQLSTHGQEVVLVGLTQKGKRRLKAWRG